MQERAYESFRVFPSLSESFRAATTGNDMNPAGEMIRLWLEYHEG